jgi:tyrosyl-tRNA synthetase
MTQENVLLTRAVEEVVPKALAEEKLNSGKKMRLYLGIDPTGSKLHLGHSVPLRKLQAFADAGHEVIFLIGSYTAMIGDPTGRDVMREPLTKEQVQENFRYYKEQAGKILDFSKIEIRYNHEWLDNLNGVEILKISSNFTVQQMMQRDMFRERLKNNEDLSSTEFLYPLLQAYDSVTLDVDCEIGGKDQLFNMLCGRKLQQRYKNLSSPQNLLRVQTDAK